MSAMGETGDGGHQNEAGARGSRERRGPRWQKILDQRTDWRCLNELKKELKG